MKNKRILVVGMGRSGKAAVTALVDAGAFVAVQDSKPADAIEPEFLRLMEEKCVAMFFGEKPSDMSIYDMLVLSPGVSPRLDFIEDARAQGTEIIGELELAYRICRGKFLAITGTNGKTTTTTLVGEIFKAAGKDVCVGGNIGRAIAVDALEASEDTWMITETSSFQLETIIEFRPVISAILNLSSDHMDRHKTMENYGRTKAAIFMNQTQDQYCVLNYDDRPASNLQKERAAKQKWSLSAEFRNWRLGLLHWQTE
ncbi:MAG: UDP-N-acetylmuramoyl-L-alanine--D-glutamate ligase [Eubacteriales bacterium]|nr:UDP-N-acetylmuramoyl-L-alanine--D-glutamate ligase [Eubacteriales bacterium]